MNTLLGGLWDRSLDHYPANARRIWYLALAVIAILALPIVVGNGSGWGAWWWVCIAGQVVFLPTILAASGHWSPARSRAAARALEQAENVEVQPNVG